MKRFAMFLLAIMVCATVAAAEDTDSDDIPDDVETEFGSGPQRAAEFKLLYHDGTAGKDDDSVPDSMQKAPDFTDISLANVARDRWLFRVDFAEKYSGGNNTFILYLDVDRDRTTGRQDKEATRGTDLMYVQKDGEFNISERTKGLRNEPLRMATIDDTIYICADIPLGEGHAEGKVRFKVLSHVSPPDNSDQDNMPWQVVAVPEKRDIQKPRIGPPPQLAPIADLSTDKPDADADGIPDTCEKVIGADPNTPETMHHIFHDKSAAEGDDLPDAYSKANDFTDLYFGNIAGNRWMWRLDFTEKFRTAKTILILYLDADNDTSTGRSGWAAGTDVMLVYSGQTFHASIRYGGVTTLNRRVRGFIDGNSVYLSMDLLLNHNDDGNTEYRAHVLSQYDQGSGDNDGAEWFTVCGPGRTEGPKPRVAPPAELHSEGIHVYDPWLTWREQLRKMDAITVDLTAAKLQNMHLEDRSLVADDADARAICQSPAAGRYFLNIVCQDSAERDETVHVNVGGEQIAEIVASANDGDIHIHTTKSRVELDDRTPIELSVDGPAQDARISEITLTEDRLRPPSLQITHLETWCSPLQKNDESVDVDVSFLTNMPCQGRVVWGRNALNNTATEDEATYNHRIRLTELQSGGQYRLRVTAGNPDADEAPSKELEFTAAPQRLQRCSVDRKSIKLSVLDAATDRPTWPVSGGVPITEGDLADASHCRLLKDGQPVAADFRELAWWPDGSVKWLLATVLHSGGEYTLEYGQQVSPQPVNDGIRIENTDDGLRVTTDILRAEVSQEKFAPPGDLWRDLNGDGEFTADEAICKSRQGAVLVDAEGNRYSTAGQPADKLQVEQSGPVRTVILAEGRLAGESGDLMKYRCRMYFYRGFPAVPTTFTLIDDEGESVFPPTMTHISSLEIPVEYAQAPLSPTSGRTLHDYDNRYIVTDGGQSETKSGHVTPAEAVRGEKSGIAVAMRDFWQMYPKGLRTENSQVTAEIFPELPEDQYADEKLTPMERTRHYYWCRNGKYMIPRGVALSYDILFYALDDRSEIDGERMAGAWDEMPLLSAQPDQHSEADAWDRLKPQTEGVFDQYQQWVDEGLTGLEKRRRRLRCYDWMNWGDTWGERSVNWTNQEYDLQWGLLVQFVRTGDLRYFHRAEQAARHTAAVDTVNVSPKKRLLGLQKAHCLGHTGGHNIPRVENAKYWFDDGIYNSGHMWTQGTFMTYCLTGDRRYFESAKLLADWLAGRYTRKRARWIHRNYGWTTIGALGGYNTIPNPWYLNAARFFCQNVVSRQDPGTGTIIHTIGECEHEPRHRGGKTFMSGVVMTGLKMLDSIDPDPDLKNAIIRNCDWMHWRMWHPSDNSFQYAQCPQFDDRSTHAGTNMSCEGLAYAYDLTGKKIYREMLVRAVGDNVINHHCSTNGKGYAMDIRMTPFALGAMRDWGLEQLPAPPAPAPEVQAPDKVYLPPEESGRLALRVINHGRQPLQAHLQITELSEDLTAERTQVEWSAKSGAHLSPEIRLSGSATGEIAAKFTVGDVEESFTARTRPAQEIEIGGAVGLVTGSDDTVAAALEQLESDLQELPDLSAATLRQYGSLLVGREAYSKNFCGLGDSWANLLDFTNAGGNVAIIQLQNTSYQTDYLPLNLTLSNESGALHKIVQKNHPIFTTPERVESLAGVISYDTIVDCDRRWDVLATDDSGNPSIVQCQFGHGTVLVIQPSPDRYVIGQEAPPEGLDEESCAQLLRNVVGWLEGN